MSCLYPQCEKVAETRGLCGNHYRVANRLIRNGQADEEDLINRGLLLESHKGGVQNTAFLKGSKQTGGG